MPAEQSCAWRGACGLAGEQRDHIYYIPPDQDRTRTSQYSRDIYKLFLSQLFITFLITNELTCRIILRCRVNNLSAVWGWPGTPVSPGWSELLSSGRPRSNISLTTGKFQQNWPAESQGGQMEECYFMTVIYHIHNQIATVQASGGRLFIPFAFGFSYSSFL